MSDSVRRPLVLIVGAGASKEVDLPVGAELKQQIARALDIRYERGLHMISGDAVVNEAFRYLALREDSRRGDINPYLHAGWRIRDAMPQAISIDNFIDSHRSVEKIAICGKLAIARCILQSEADSSLYVDYRNNYNKINFSGVEKTWFNAFFQLLTENTQKTEIGEKLSKIAIICFNYDRCIEHYLHSALQNYYGMSSEEASVALSSLEIHHPYGTVGKLPWQDPHEGFQYGATPSPQKLLALAGELRTFTEGVDSSKSDIAAIRSIVASAERVAFLGFAFHRLNMDLLFPSLADIDEDKFIDASVYATAHSISLSDSSLIKRELANLAGFPPARIYLRNDLRCFALFQEFWRSLSLH